MAIDKRLLDILCCPSTRQPLALLNADQLAAVNRAVAAGQVAQSDGANVGARLDAGLITRDGRTIYRIDDGVPVMLVDQAIGAQQIGDFPA